MKVFVGHSEDVESQDAIDEILDTCAHQLGELTPNAGIFVASESHDLNTISSRILEQYPDLELIGCSSNAELSSEIGFAEDSIALMLFQSERVTMKVGVGRDAVNDPRGASLRAIQMASEGMNERPAMCLTLPEAWNISIRDVLDGMAEALGPDVPVFGGQASNENHVSETVQCCKSEVLSNGVPVMLFYGPLDISFGVNSGWKPVGSRHTVTRSEGNVVYTINDRPAEELFVEYFGELSIFFPVAIYPEEDDQFYLAAPAKVIEDGAVFFYNYVYESATLRFADASPDEIIAGAEKSSHEAISSYPGDQPTAALIFSCAGRLAALGSRTKEEVQLLMDQLGDNIPLIGFYTSGELCPLKGQKSTQAHGGTFTTLLLGES